MEKNRDIKFLGIGEHLNNPNFNYGEYALIRSNLRSGLVGHWSFNTADKSNRTNATDKSGLQNHGTVTGATFTNQGRFKEGYKFDEDNK